LAESRTGRRFPLNLPIHLREGATAEVEGTTTNLSAAGVYIKAEADLEVGSNIEFDITLPAEVIGSEKDVTIRCQGRVVRTEKAKTNHKKKAGKEGSDKDDWGGVACVIDHYKFIRTP
jgi:PilZ domain